jgi:hypothetical protein
VGPLSSILSWQPTHTTTESIRLTRSGDFVVDIYVIVIVCVGIGIDWRPCGLFVFRPRASTHGGQPQRVTSRGEARLGNGCDGIEFGF